MTERVRTRVWTSSFTVRVSVAPAAATKGLTPKKKTAFSSFLTTAPSTTSKEASSEADTAVKTGLWPVTSTRKEPTMGSGAWNRTLFTVAVPSPGLVTFTAITDRIGATGRLGVASAATDATLPASGKFTPAR